MFRPSHLPLRMQVPDGTFAKEGEQPRTFPVKTAAAIDSLINLQSTQYPADAFLMNMTSNHDLNSWEGTEFERLGIYAPAFAALTYVLPGMKSGSSTAAVSVPRFTTAHVAESPFWRLMANMVMIKTLKPEFRDMPEYRAMIEKEFDTRYNLAHPNIVMINDFSGLSGGWTMWFA